jgi:hypothetical protein
MQSAISGCFPNQRLILWPNFNKALQISLAHQVTAVWEYKNLEPLHAIQTVLEATSEWLIVA